MDVARLLVYLDGLAENNNKAWFEAHREEYQPLRAEFVGLVGEILARVAVADGAIEHLRPQDCLFRINRDVRFSRDKSPYKTQFSAILCPQGRNVNLPSYYFHIAAGGELMAGGGMYAPDPAQLAAVRRYIQAHPHRLEMLLADPALTAMGGIEGESFKRLPLGVPPGAPHMAILMRKQYLAGEAVDVRDFPPGAVADWVVGRFIAVAPFVQWLRDALGPPTRESQGAEGGAAGASLYEKPPIDVF